MLRVLAIAVIFALAAPSMAAAEPNDPHHKDQKSGGQPRGTQQNTPQGGNKPTGAKPFVQPQNNFRQTVQPQHGPVITPQTLGPSKPQFTHRGRAFNRVHLAPFAYPSGWGYRRWTVGVMLPSVFLAPTYYYTDWDSIGLESPPPGYQWVRYGPDLLLVDVNTGQVADVVYGVFY